MQLYKNNPTIVISARDLAQLVDERERAAQIKVLRKIKPLGNGRKIEEMITRIVEGTLDTRTSRRGDQKKNRIPREVKLCIRSVEDHRDYSDIDQFIVTGR